MIHHTIISGGGLAGLSLALKLGQAGLSVALVEPQPFTHMTQHAYDARTSAIALAGQRFYEGMGIWQPMLNAYDDNALVKAGPITDIRIVDGEAPGFLHFDHAEVGDAPMGHIIENRVIRRTLLEALAGIPNVHIYNQAAITEHTRTGDSIEVALSTGETLRGQLLAITEGKNSPSRARAGIGVRLKDYQQKAMICLVRHALPHDNIAVEKFTPNGPFASLPMRCAKTGEGIYSAIVWTESTAQAEHFMALPEADYIQHLSQRFGEWCGALTLAGARGAYPLSLMLAERYTAPQLCVLGDACHAIHPIAGQGFNLSLRDVACVAEQVIHSAQLGLNVGSETALAPFAQLRTLDNMRMVYATDALNWLFAQKNSVVTFARRAGIQAVQHLPPLKRFFIKNAMGA